MGNNTSDRVQNLVNKASDLITSAYSMMEEGNYSMSIERIEKSLIILDGLFGLKKLKDIQIGNNRTLSTFDLISDLQQCYLNMERTDEALELMDRYPTIYKNKKNQLMIRSNIYALKNDWKNEMKCYNELIRSNKKDIKTHIKIANNIKKAHPGKVKQIREILDGALKYARKDPSLSSELAKAYRELLGDIEKAEGILNQVRNMKKKKPFEYWLERGEVYLQMNELELAFGAFEHASELKDMDIPTMVKLIEVYQRLGDYEKARDLCEKGLKMDPSHDGLLKLYRHLMGDSSISIVKNMDNNEM